MLEYTCIFPYIWACQDPSPCSSRDKLPNKWHKLCTEEMNNASASWWEPSLHTSAPLPQPGQNVQIIVGGLQSRDLLQLYISDAGQTCRTGDPLLMCTITWSLIVSACGKSIQSFSIFGINLRSLHGRWLQLGMCTRRDILAQYEITCFLQRTKHTHTHTHAYIVYIVVYHYAVARALVMK